MIILGQTVTNLDVSQYFSTKETAVPVIKKHTLPLAKGFCTCVTQCVPDLVVFTDSIGTDPIKNDWNSFFMKTVNTLLATASTIAATITNKTTGVTNPLVDPTHGDLFVGNLYYWFKVDWTKVNADMGPGRYIIQFEETSNFGGQVINELCSETYHLRAYNDVIAQRTIVIESFNQGKLHHGNDYSALTTAAIPTPFPFEQRTRLPGR